MTGLSSSPLRFSYPDRQLTGQDATIELNEPMADCIQLLLRRQGQVVSAEEILDVCWGKKNLVVSTASVRQMLTLLRKHLRSLGITENVIITVPRRGYSLAPGYIQGTPGEEPAPSASLTDPPPAPPLPQQPEEPAPVPDPVTHSSRWFYRWPALLMLALISVVLSAAILWLRQASYQHPISYIPLQVEQGQHFYIQAGFNSGQDLILRFNSLDKFQGWDRDSYPWVYFNRADSDDYLSAFVCQKPMDDSHSACFSLLIVRGNNG